VDLREEGASRVSFFLLATSMLCHRM
jgi:hypothetical protein